MPTPSSKSAYTGFRLAFRVVLVSNERIKHLLLQLKEELDNADDLDAETVSLAQAVDDDIHQLVESGEGQMDSVLDRAGQLEARFAVDHPLAEKFLREIIDGLGKLGI